MTSPDDLLSLPHPPFVVRLLALVPLIKSLAKLATLSNCHQRCGRSDKKEDVKNFQFHFSAAEHWEVCCHQLNCTSYQDLEVIL